MSEGGSPVQWLDYGLEVRRIVGRFHAGAELFLFSEVFRWALGPIQPPTQWLPRAFSQKVKTLGREADHLPPYSAKVQKAWRYISTPPRAFRTCTGTTLHYSFVSFILSVAGTNKIRVKQTSHTLLSGFAYLNGGQLAISRHVIRKAMWPATSIKIFCGAELVPKFIVALQASRSALPILNIRISLQCSPTRTQI